MFSIDGLFFQFNACSQGATMSHGNGFSSVSSPAYAGLVSNRRRTAGKAVAATRRTGKMKPLQPAIPSNALRLRTDVSLRQIAYEFSRRYSQNGRERWVIDESGFDRPYESTLPPRPLEYAATVKVNGVPRRSVRVPKYCSHNELSGYIPRECHISMIEAFAALMHLYPNGLDEFLAEGPQNQIPCPGDMIDGRIPSLFFDCTDGDCVIRIVEMGAELFMRNALLISIYRIW